MRIRMRIYENIHAPERAGEDGARTGEPLLRVDLRDFGGGQHAPVDPDIIQGSRPGRAVGPAEARVPSNRPDRPSCGQRADKYPVHVKLHGLAIVNARSVRPQAREEDSGR